MNNDLKIIFNDRLSFFFVNNEDDIFSIIENYGRRERIAFEQGNSKDRITPSEIEDTSNAILSWWYIKGDEWQPPTEFVEDLILLHHYICLNTFSSCLVEQDRYELWNTVFTKEAWNKFHNLTKDIYKKFGRPKKYN